MGIKAQQRKKSRLKRGLERLRKVTLPGFSKRLRKLRAAVVRRIAAIARRIREIRRANRPDFNGYPSNVSEAIKDVIVRANRAGLYVTSTTGGTHAPGSYHYSGRAVDVAGAYDRMVAFQKDEFRRGTQHYRELFGPDNHANVKNGMQISLGEGTALENQHDNHVHVAI